MRDERLISPRYLSTRDTSRGANGNGWAIAAGWRVATDVTALSRKDHDLERGTIVSHYQQLMIGGPKPTSVWEQLELRLVLPREVFG